VLAVEYPSPVGPPWAVYRPQNCPPKADRGCGYRFADGIPRRLVPWRAGTPWTEVAAGKKAIMRGLPGLIDLRAADVTAAGLFIRSSHAANRTCRSTQTSRHGGARARFPDGQLVLTVKRNAELTGNRRVDASCFHGIRRGLGWRPTGNIGGTGPRRRGGSAPPGRPEPRLRPDSDLRGDNSTIFGSA